ncbi:choline binding-anchored murein hydrolase CbpD [uncultured Streptococcus sp.]|uniref:choline binding-anchored murein hydrolase CbpD n=1 Tax=uncultured Streptococcus sp. TaxID=83427 RepID=UPI0028D83BF8|nr:choline binding-anchored murein hydrolase CbpD [uncultured Streptococcus sp.]
MKILPCIARGTSYCLKMSVKKVVPFLVVGLMLAAGDNVYAYSGANGSIARGDDYPVYYKNGSQEIDQWRMYSRQCTSFAAFRLSNVNGFEIPAAYGNANEWGYRARREGYRVDNTPAIGSIAWSTAGTYGHVAWVSNVVGDEIEIEEYNYGIRESYNKRVVKANTMTGFIHFKDLAGGSFGNSQTSVSTGGTHYFKAKSAIKNQPLASATAIDYYYPGENVHYDQILEKDGYKWLSYTAYNGSRRYVQLEAVNTNPLDSHVLNDSRISSTGGTHFFKAKSAIKTQPLASATTIDYYYSGENVHYDQILEKDGYKWLSYTAYNGSRRYVQLEEVSHSDVHQPGNTSNNNTDSSLAINWKKVNGSWYHFKSNGSKSTGWLKDGSNWYYLKSSGEMQTGWLQEKGFWYYLDDSGAMKTGWYQVSGKWYYSYSSGELAVNTIVDGYTVNHNGEWV